MPRIKSESRKHPKGLIMSHPFTEKGLGLGPFTCIRVEKCPGVKCAYCGEFLIWCYVIRSGEDAKEFTVGCECAKKCDTVLRKSLSAILREYRVSEARKRLADEKIRKQLTNLWHDENKTELEWIEHSLGKYGYAKERDKAINFLLGVFP
jgi:hypothetical protein